MLLRVFFQFHSKMSSNQFPILFPSSFSFTSTQPRTQASPIFASVDGRMRDPENEVDNNLLRQNKMASFSGVILKTAL